MALKDALAANTGTSRAPQCKTCGLLATLKPADAKDLAEALADSGTWTASGIARALKAEGHNVTPGAVARHRRGDCKP